MKKKFLLGIILTVALVCMFAISVSAYETIDGIRYDLKSSETGNTATVSQSNRNGACTLTEVVIPETVTFNDITYQVTGISNNAFEYCTALETLVIKPKLEQLPGWMVQGSTNLKKVYIDFSNITTLGTRALTLATKDDMNPVSGQEFKLYTVESYGTGTDIEITEVYFDKVVSIGSGAFNNTSLKKVTIGASCTSIGIQTFRFGDLDEITVESNVNIPSYFCADNYSLTKVYLQSHQSIGTSAFASCKLVEEIHVDLSNCTYVGGSAFILSTKYDAGNTLTQWYNLEGKKIVDLSKVQTLGTRAFASSNIGGASRDANGNLVHGTTKVVFPTALKSAFTTGDSSTFRNCNITGSIYMNFADDANEGIYIDTWALRGNYFETVVFGDNVKQINGQPLNGTKTLENVVFLADDVALNDNIFNNCNSGINFYYKKITTTASIANKIDILITDGSVTTYSACGFIAYLTPVEGEKVVLNLAIHYYEGVADQTVCPAGSLMIYTCVGCKNTYKKELENYVGGSHVFDRANGATVVDVVFGADSYFGEGVIVVKCAHCTQEANDEETVGALFIADGYSIPEDGTTDCISHTIRVNKSNIAKYEELTGNVVNYGITAGVKDSVANPISIKDGKIVANDYAVSADMTGTEYTKLVIKITGLEKGINVSCNAYIVFNVDPTKIYYLCNDEVTTEAQAKSL